MIVDRLTHNIVMYYCYYFEWNLAFELNSSLFISFSRCMNLRPNFEYAKEEGEEGEDGEDGEEKNHYFNISLLCFHWSADAVTCNV